MQLWWQQFLLIFLRTNVIFCTKSSLISYGGSSSSQGCALSPMRSFSARAVASIAVWKSAPVIDCYAMILMWLINMSTLLARKTYDITHTA